MSLVAALYALSLAATPVSSSQLGFVVESADSDVTTILAACPRLVVVSLPADGVTQLDSTVGDVLQAYVTSCEGAQVVVQVGGGGDVDLSDPVSSWNSWLVQVQAAASFFPITGVEGPSEPQGTTAELAAFWSLLALQIHGSDFFPIVGALPSGLPSGAGSSSDAFCTVASQVSSEVGGPTQYGWSYHARSPTMTTVLATEESSTLAYRQIAADCELTAPIFLTQAGPTTGGWQTTSGLAWAEWLDGEVQQDSEVVAAALFELGGSDGFTLTPLVSDLATYLANPTVTDGGGTGDGGTGPGSASGGGGVGPGYLGTTGVKGCATGGAGALALLAVPLFLRRRRVRYGAKR
jgi:hypothetical protein